MSCSSCAASVPADALFCSACGAAVRLRCGGCGRLSPLEVAFCSECGTSMRSAPDATGPAAADASDRLALGERRVATVMFTDLSGYTAITERLDPEEVASVVNEIKEAVASIVESHGGLPNQFAGDGVMALFGIPTAEDNDPRRAVAAALAIHAEVRAQSERRLGTPMTMHTGIHTGLVIAQQRDQRDGVYAVTGDAANTASRLLSLAERDQILVGPDTLAEVAPFFDAEPLGSFDLKGKAAALTVHRILGERTERTRFDAAREFGLTPWTGRAEELAVLEESFQAVLAGECRAVAIVGEAGVGKSRLCHEFLSRLDREEARVYEGRCQSYGAVIPYLPFIQAFRAGLGLREGDTGAQIIARTAENVRQIDPNLERYLPVALHLLSAPSHEYPMPPEWRGEELPAAIQEAVVAINVALAQRRPSVLHFADWHWSDEASAATLRHFLRGAAGHPILVVVEHRPHYRADWAEHTPTEISLEPFGLWDTRELVRRCLECGDVQEELVVKIQERTIGNPLFVEEICASLVQSDRVERDGDTIRLRGNVADLDLPQTVQTVIRSRIDKLIPQARELLRLASVIGREFSFDLLDRLVPRGWRTHELLLDLEQLDFVQPIPREEGGAFHFRHVTTQEVTYATLPQRQRSGIHLRVAQLIEQIYAGDRLEDRLEALADHYLAAGEDERAVHYLERAGAKASASYAIDQARRHYQRAVERSALLGDDETAVRRRVQLTLRWAETCIYSPSLGQLGLLDRALAETESLGDDVLAMRVSYWIAWIFHSVGDQHRALVVIERALALSGPAAVDRLVSPFRRLRGQCLLISRDSEAAIELLEEVVASRREAARNDAERLGGTYAYALSQLGLLVAQRGDFELGTSHFGEAIDLVRKLGLRSSESAILITLGLLKTMQGDWAGVVRVAEEMRDIAEHMRAPYHIATGQILEGYARFKLGEMTIGLRRLREGIARLEASGAFLTLAWSLACLADALAELGRLDEARRTAEKALDRHRTGDRLGEDIAARALVRIAAAESAENLDRESRRLLAMTRDRGNPREYALAALCCAEALVRSGSKEAALGPLEAARAQLRDLDMAYYASRAAELTRQLEPVAG